METVTLTVNDIQVTVTGTFDRGEKGDRDCPGVSPSFEMDSHDCSDEDLEYLKSEHKNILSHLEDLALEELTSN